MDPVEDLLLSGFGCLKMNPDDADYLSFLDQHLKLDTAAHAEPVARRIEALRSVRTLELKGNTLGIGAGERISTALLRHPELQRCLWSDMFTGRLKNEIPPILRSLTNAMIRAGCHITELDLSDNAFGPIGAEGIQDFLVSPSAYSLEVLKLNNNGLGAGGKIIAKCLLDCHRNATRDKQQFKLKTFIAGRNRLENPGATALAEAFSAIGTLEIIKLPQNGIRPEGIIQLARSFEANVGLKVIDLEDNTCDSNGAISIAEAITDLVQLEELNLGDCLCRSAGCACVIAQLCDGRHYNLKKVNLSGSELPAVRAKLILKSWTQCFGSTNAKLEMRCNMFGSMFSSLADLVSRNNLNVDLGNESEDEGSHSENYSDSDDSEDGGTESDDEAEEFDGILSFENQQLKLNTAADAESVARRIESLRSVRTLELKGNTLGIGAGERISTALLRHPELQRCLWSDMFTGRLKNEIPPILRSLTNAMIRAGCHITELDLSDNAFGPIGAEGIQDFLVSPSAYSLEVLKLNNNGLGAGGKIIAKCLLDCHRNATRDKQQFKLKTFIAGRNRLENPGATALAEAFSAIGTLEIIKLPQNGIRPEGIIQLARSFEANVGLKVIDLEDNTCDSNGAISIAEAITDLVQLEELNLGDCLCRSAGCASVIAQLCDGRHHNLKKVNLSGSELPAVRAKLILKSWTQCFGNANTKLEMRCNMFGSTFDDLVDFVSSNNLNVDLGNESEDEGSHSENYSDSDDSEDGGTESDDEAEEFDGILSFENQQLKLNTAADAESVARRIESLRSVRTLELKGNTLGIGAGERISTALLRHPELQRCLWSDMFTGRLKNEIPPILRSLTNAMIRAGCHITELDLSDNAFGPIGAEGIQDFLVSPSAYSLEVLKLNNNGLGAGGKIIAKCLLDCHRNATRDKQQFKLKTFIAGRNRLENPGATALAEAFSAIGTLEIIKLPQNGIRPEGIIQLARSFEANVGLKVIDLEDNTCDSNGAISIAEAITDLVQLEELNLGDCLCRSAGCASVIAQLCDGRHHNLKKVNLSGSELPAVRAKLILKSWTQCFGNANTKLEMRGNMFGSMFDDLVDFVSTNNLNVDLGNESEDEGSVSEKYSDSDDDEEDED